MAKIFNPYSRVISIEPCQETFKLMKQGLSWWWSRKIEYYNIALGNGKSMCFHNKKNRGMNRFYSEEEKKWWPKNSYTIDSKTLKQIFIDYNIDTNKPYIIKIDCEGGERFLIHSDFEEESLEYIRNSVQTIIEIHFGLGGTIEQWNFFINKLKNTHELRIGGWRDKKTIYRRYVYDPYNEIPYNRGHLQIELVNKEWVVKGY